MPRKKGSKNLKTENTPIEVEVVAAEPTQDISAQASEAEALIPAEIEILPAGDELPIDAEEVETSVAARKKAAATLDVVPYDALTAYLREIRRYPRLSREAEYDLALRYAKHKDLEAAYKLVSSNLWLVVKIAKDYEKAARNVLDLIQEGSIGLMEAVKNFDPYRNVRFPSYAVWWIRAYIVRYIIANWRLVKIGTTQAQRKLFFNLKREKERIEREGFTPEPKLIADRLNVKESEVVEMEQRLAGSDLSVDTPFEHDADSNLLSILPSSDSSAEDLFASKQMKQLLARSLAEFEGTLSPKEQVILNERMLSEEKVTLQEVAEKLNLSRERIRQVENRIKEKLKVFLEEKLGSNLKDLDL